MIRFKRKPSNVHSQQRKRERVRQRVHMKRRPRLVLMALTQTQREIREQCIRRLDPDFKKVYGVDLPVTTRTTRYSKKIFTRIADNLPVLDADHSIVDEANQFYTFKRNIEHSHAVYEHEKVGSTWMTETHHAIWCSRMIRYTGMAQRGRSLAINKEVREYVGLFNGCHSTVSQDIRRVLGRQKPVCVLVGGRVRWKTTGHCTVLVIQEREGVRNAWLKDALPVEQATVRRGILVMLKSLGINFITLVGELDLEREVTHTECIKESYRVVGQTLDGTFFWERRLDGFTKVFDAASFKQVN